MDLSVSSLVRSGANNARTSVGFCETPANTKTKNPSVDAMKEPMVQPSEGSSRLPGKENVVNGLQPSWSCSVQTARLAVQDSPRSSYPNRLDYKSAFRLTCLFSKHNPDMPPKVGPELHGLLVSGAFQHTCDSHEQPIKHQLSKEMFDAIKDELKWNNTTYDRWFILARVYGVKTLRQQCQGIVDAVLTCCGKELDKSLAY